MDVNSEHSPSLFRHDSFVGGLRGCWMPPLEVAVTARRGHVLDQTL